MEMTPEEIKEGTDCLQSLLKVGEEIAQWAKERINKLIKDLEENKLEEVEDFEIRILYLGKKLEQKWQECIEKFMEKPPKVEKEQKEPKN